MIRVSTKNLQEGQFFLSLKDISSLSFIEKQTHHFQIAYISSSH